MPKRIRRGDIFYCDFGYDNLIGSEQKGIRPVVVIQNNVGNTHSPTVIVASITSKGTKKPLPTHVPLEYYYGLTPNCTILVEQQRTIDKSRLRDYVTYLKPQDLPKLNEAIKISLGLN